MERTIKTTLWDNRFKKQHVVYVTFEDRTNKPPQLVRVAMAGDLLDITDKLTDKEKARIEKRLARRNG